MFLPQKAYSCFPPISCFSINSQRSLAQCGTQNSLNLRATGTQAEWCHGTTKSYTADPVQAQSLPDFCRIALFHTIEDQTMLFTTAGVIC